ncbi:phospholipid scramblase family member 5-like [Plodia interpunctella]|uniref:phospholipid scramblase family member 5-like n=1 Tax=Plodia interpunctella TaxID=58824 RepID=UPI00236868EC|nr:phospholipid scramblase family member 5-like [Plodia interpunctella]
MFNRNIIEMMQAAPIPPSPTQVFPDAVKRPGVPEVDVTPEVQEEAEPVLQVATPAPFEELSSVDRLLITKRLRVKRALLFRGKRNRFFVRTPDQNLLYTVEEENSWWVGYFCSGLRPLQLHVNNSDGAEVMRVSRPFACTPRLLPCQLQTIQVYAPPENLIGTVEQIWTAIAPEYVVKDAEGNEVLWIHGPKITLSCFQDVQFHITKPDGTAAGATCKRWQGLKHALFYAPVSDRCGVAFERDLSGVQKALLLAATLIFEYLYYDI